MPLSCLAGGEPGRSDLIMVIMLIIMLIMVIMVIMVLMVAPKVPRLMEPWCPVGI